MKYLFGNTFCIALSVACTQGAWAATQVVPFNADIQASCLISLNEPGALVSDGLFKLSSKAAGGSAGQVTIVALGGKFNVSTTAPTSFTTEPEGVGATTFSSSYSAAGATTAADVEGGFATELQQGETKLTLDLIAETSEGPFPAGQYQADVTVTCE